MQLYSLRSLATDSNNHLDMVTDELRPFVDSLCEKGSKKADLRGSSNIWPGEGGYSPIKMTWVLVGKFREHF